jgi:hypothetical protein
MEQNPLASLDELQFWSFSFSISVALEVRRIKQGDRWAF